MFKILALGVLVPLQWSFLVLVAWLIGGNTYALTLVIALPVLLYSHIRVLEESRSMLETVRFLFNVFAHGNQVETIRQERETLAIEVHDLVNEVMDPQVISTMRQSIMRSTTVVQQKASPLKSLRRNLSTTDSLLR
jgi:glycerol-3-phosphate O-acyltransferase/dihydroxyacetone phosphate acyltransferase